MCLSAFSLNEPEYNEKSFRLKRASQFHMHTILCAWRKKKYKYCYIYGKKHPIPRMGCGKITTVFQFRQNYDDEKKKHTHRERMRRSIHFFLGMVEIVRCACTRKESPKGLCFYYGCICATTIFVH